jgi:hypothetical protein
MSLSDCPKCWDTPCTCGYMYAKWDDDKVMELVKAILKSRDDRRKEEDEANGVELLKTIFLTDPETGKPATMTNARQRGSKSFVIHTQSDKSKWKHTIKSEEA